MTTHSDSDWVGCKDTRRSTSAGVILLGGHTLKAYARKQKIIASSVGSFGESKGIVSLLKDLGYEMKPVLVIDAKAIEHILHKHGLGRLKHIVVAFLWMQDEIRSERLRVRMARSEENVADLGTKPLSKAVIAKHCLTLGYVNMAEETEARRTQQVTMTRKVRKEPAAATTAKRSSSSKRMSSNNLAAQDADEANPKMFVKRHRKNERYFEMFADIIEQKGGYEKFYEQFGKVLERAIHEDSTNQTEVAELVRFSNTKSGDELNRLKEHVDHTKAAAE